ncbi:MAG: single-stranded-DNA-specific exonuclease RecJ [Candidatus Villigracilaceae bacterium]
MHPKRWLIAPPLTPQADSNLRNYPPIVRQILFNRGYATAAQAETFLEAQTDFDTHPFQMTGMQASVDRIRYAIAHHEPIAIYGDYDVDGVTATALLTQALKALGGNVRPYIPNRFDEGYGLNPEALNSLKEDGVKLVISVDCGIRSPNEAAHARTLGLDLIITDHHHPAEELPPAFAILNPKQPEDTYPDKDLAGVGVAYKLAEALLLESGLQATERVRFLNGLLDLVALGTVADLAPLTGENRHLVRRGLEQMRSTQRQGLFSLANVAGLNLSRVTSSDIGFVLGPRLNAAGRLDSALAAYELLVTSDIRRAGDLAQKLDRQNRERQALTQQIQEQAEVLARAGEADVPLLFAVHPEFNPGVVGLAASRLAEIYYRPAIVGQLGEETLRCSCRSIPELHITNALDECADLLVRHGGHAAAAGFTVRVENLEALKARLKEIARRELGGRDLRPTLSADVEVPLSAMHPDLLRYLTKLQPTGYGNPEPIFVSRGVQVKSARQVGASGKHLKMTVSDGQITFDAIGFRLGHLYENLPARVDLMYAFETNEYNGRISLQLNLKDVKPAGTPD